jgi:hypothetical protein
LSFRAQRGISIPGNRDGDRDPSTSRVFALRITRYAQDDNIR